MEELRVRKMTASSGSDQTEAIQERRKAGSAGPNRQGRRVMMVAGEASGDLHGGALAEALYAKNPHLQIIGFGGNAMRKAGVDVRFDIERLGVVGIFEVFLHLKSVVQAYRSALRLLKEGIDLLVLIDYPDFNLRLAKAAKALGIQVVYYISPQIWAWRAGRIKTIAARVDQMLVILPFEQEIYQSAHVPCEFVGHPLLDEIGRLGIAWPSKAAYLKDKALHPSGTTVGLLPGSRKREVIALLPAMLRGMELLAKEMPGLQLLIPVAPSLPEGLISELARSYSFPIRCVEGEVYDVLRASEVVVVASGTATLQAALAGTPMIIVYKLAPTTYWLARRLIHLKSVGLVNIVAGNPFIPELIQDDASPERICEAVLRLLKDAEAREKMKQGLKGVVGRLGTAGASNRAASVIDRFLEAPKPMRGGAEREALS
jgi:lipid-A-disaccharide synthase